MLMTAEDTEERRRRIERTANKLRKMWPPETRVRAPSKRRKSSVPRGGVSLPPTQSAPPAAGGPEAGTTSGPSTAGSIPSGAGPAVGPTTSAPAGGGQEPAAIPTRRGPREGEYIDTQRTIVWLRATGHRVRWLAKQLGVSHAHMRSVLLGLSKLSYPRCRRLEAMLALGEGGAVS